MEPEKMTYSYEKIKIHGRILGSLIDFIIPAIIFIIVGIDTRFHPGSIGFLVQLSAGVLFILSCILIIWAMSANYQFNALISDEQNENTVVRTGPYRFVRHPGYAGGVVFYLALPLLLCSFWAFIPASINSVLIFYYTALEDAMLQADIPSYSEYARNVPYRIIPKIW